MWGRPFACFQSRCVFVTSPSPPGRTAYRSPCRPLTRNSSPRPGVAVGSPRPLKLRQDQFVRNLTEKLLTYAMGRGVERTDNCNLKEIVQRVAREDNHFSALVTEIVHRNRRVGLTALPCGNHPREGGTVLALLDRTLVLHPVVVEIRLAILRDMIEREENRGLLNVRVVARSPSDEGQRWVWPKPFLA